MNTYCPEDVKVIVNGIRIEAMSEQFLKIGKDKVVLTLNGTSKHIKALKELYFDDPVFIEVYGGWIDDQGFAEAPYEIEGRYSLTDYTWNLSTGLPTIDFTFHK